MNRQYTYRYPRPMMTVDAVVFRRSPTGLMFLAIERGNPPFQGQYALPGGFVEEHEPLDNAATRELAEETGLCGVSLTQFHTFGTPGRDPRGWSISVAYYVVLEREPEGLAAADDAAALAWLSAEDHPPLAFDHDDIVREALRALR